MASSGRLIFLRYHCIISFLRLRSHYIFIQFQTPPPDIQGPCNLSWIPVILLLYISNQIYHYSLSCIPSHFSTVPGVNTVCSFQLSSLQFLTHKMYL